jgi:hypothetical protein
LAVSHRFPRYDLESSLEVARKTRDKGGGEASSDELASWLEYKSKNNGAYLSRVAAAKMYGFIDGSATLLRSTQRALDILEPDYPETRQRAKLAAFEAVPLFGAFLGEFEGKQLPPPQGMRNALVNKFGVKSTLAPLALARLLDSAEQAGLFKTAGGRTKMIRPTLRANHDQDQAGGSFDQSGDEVIDSRQEQAERYPLLIRGAMEQLPTKGEWSEAELKDWLQLIELALRVVYRLPGSPKGDS